MSTPASADQPGTSGRLQQLLDVAAAQDVESALSALLEQALTALVPDEALIVKALTERPEAALVHIHSWTRTGIEGEAILENASLIGRTAKVRLPELTPHYVTRLRFLGLAEIGPENEGLHEEYQNLLADPAVLSAMSVASTGAVTPHVMRHTVRLSKLGLELWHFAASV